VPTTHDPTLLDELAEDPVYVTEVRELASALLAAGVVGNIREVSPLLRYGPQTSASALRLAHLPRLADLDAVPELSVTWARLVTRLKDAEV
jgi:hypothetical protein